MLLLLVITVSLIMSKGVFAQSRPGYGEPLATYEDPEGFTVISYATKWNTPSKLRQVAKELLANEHGEEIAYLKNLYLYPDSPDGILAYTHFNLTRDSSGGYIYKDDSYIEIFDANQYNSRKDMAWVLSHEYGHHFTIYHLVNKENKFFNEWQNTGYAKVRDIVNHPDISYQLDAIGNFYKWDIMEMAAEDYVQLFGSVNARGSTIYKDIQQQIHEDISSQFNYPAGFNMQPQDNSALPLAADVRGLEQYWRSLAKLPKQKRGVIPNKPKMRLVSKKEVANGRYQYRIEWDELPGNEKYEYTLVSYPEGAPGFPYPVKTVIPGDSTHAFIGNGLKTDLTTGRQQLIIDDYNGRHTFQLYIKDRTNKIYRGEPLEVNFNYPVIDYEGPYKDILPMDWSYDAVKQLHSRNIMVGSPDNCFYPLNSLTYTDLTVVLDRIDGPINWEGIPTGSEYVKRDEMALLIHHYMMSKNLYFRPVYANPKFQDYSNVSNEEEVTYLYQRGIIGGNNSFYYPKNNATRQEFASIVLRILKD